MGIQKDKLSKPEKQSTKDMDFCHKASVLYRDWQAYHDQEMQRVVEDAWKEARKKFRIIVEHEQGKVKQLEEAVDILQQEKTVANNKATKEYLDLMGKVKQLEQQIKDSREVSEEYNELIMAVGKKYPNETRHQTALRYIKNAEIGDMTGEKSNLIYGDKQ